MSIDARQPWRVRLAQWIAGGAHRRVAPAPSRVATALVRMYAGARPSRSTAGFATYHNTSADAELSTSLGALRARSRQMVRDNPYAKRAKALIRNNVIGAGIGTQAQVRLNSGDLNTRVNDAIEWAWHDWCMAARCHTGGALHFADIERLAIGEVFESGEVFIRVHGRRFADSAVPLALEVIEAERLANEFDTPALLQQGVRNDVRMGVELDEFSRPVAYYIRRRHPGDIRRVGEGPDQFERVPAGEIYHLKLTDRWPQVRGVPWLHTVLRKLDAMNEYSQAEVNAARDSAMYFATVESTVNPDGPVPLADEQTEGEAPVYNMESGLIQHLEPGQKLNFHAPNRPNTAIDAFLRYMLREVCAGIDISFASLSQNYSDANYSSSRLSLLDDRDAWRALQQWWVRSFRQPLHELWLQRAVLAGAVSGLPITNYAPNPAKYHAAQFKVRGWSWVDPGKEVAAYREAERAGYITKTQIIAQTGNGLDIEDVVADRRRELDLLEQHGIVTDTVPTVAVPAAPPPPAPPAEDDDDDPNGDDENESSEDDPPTRVVSFRR